jgi:hypothetical protein
VNVDIEEKGGLSMTFPHDPMTGGQAHVDAIDRLDAALDEQERRHDDSEAALGGPGEMVAATDLAAANEQVAARRAWLSYIEEGPSLRRVT